MKRYRKKQSEAYQLQQRFSAGHPKPSKSVPLAQLEPLIQRQSLLRLQIGLAGLLRNRQRIEMRMSKAIAAKRLDQAKVLGKLHIATTEKAKLVAAEIASRTTIAETGKPKPSGKRKPRATELHSKVRQVKPSGNETAPVAWKPSETTRTMEAEREAERAAFSAELKRRST